jgi:hypothetical protein
MTPLPLDRGAAFTRRGFLLGGAGLFLAAACGGGDDDTSSSSEGNGAAKSTLLAYFDPNQFAVSGAPQRMPFGVGNSEGIPVSDAPASLELEVQRDGRAVGQPLQVKRHNDGIPRPYYPVVATFDAPGIYTVAGDIDGSPAKAEIAVASPDQIRVPAPGRPMPPMPTPTTANAQGVTPICTRKPAACPLHDVSLDQALGEGRPLAFLISTPAYCQQQVCGPVLDVLLNQRDDFGDKVRMVHAEVYQNPEQSLGQVSAAVQALSLTYEPVLFLMSADGVVRRRLDLLYDNVELRAALEELTA